MRQYVTENWKRVEFCSCRRRKIWFSENKFDQICRGKFDKRGILFCPVLVGCIFVDSFAELDVHHITLDLEIRATLHCYKTKNYKFTTMFHLRIKYFMHGLVIGILWLFNECSWIYLTCCGVLIDFSFFLPYSIFINIAGVFFEGSVLFLYDFCVINHEILIKFTDQPLILRKDYCKIDIAQWPWNTTKSTTNREDTTQYSLLVLLIKKAGGLGHTPEPLPLCGSLRVAVPSPRLRFTLAGGG